MSDTNHTTFHQRALTVQDQIGWWDPISTQVELGLLLLNLAKVVTAQGAELDSLRRRLREVERP